MSLIENVQELVEGFLNETVDQMFLGSEIEIDGARRTTDDFESAYDPIPAFTRLSFSALVTCRSFNASC